jgi:hypothetical protein
VTPIGEPPARFLVCDTSTGQQLRVEGSIAGESWTTHPNVLKDETVQHFRGLGYTIVTGAITPPRRRKQWKEQRGI